MKKILSVLLVTSSFSALAAETVIRFDCKPLSLKDAEAIALDNQDSSTRYIKNLNVIPSAMTIVTNKLEAIGSGAYKVISATAYITPANPLHAPLQVQLDRGTYDTSYDIFTFTSPALGNVIASINPIRRRVSSLRFFLGKAYLSECFITSK